MSSLQLFNRQITDPRTQDYLQTVLGSKKNSFVNNLTALVANNVQLQACDPMTVMHAAIKATALDLPLDPNLGYAYVIPYKNNRTNPPTTDAQFQIGFKGFIQLAMRSGQFKTINVRDVKEGEIIGEDFISGENQYKRISENRESAKTIGFVAYFELVNGFRKSLYMSTDEINVHAEKYSKTFKSNNSTWKTEFEAMAEKTVLKRLLSKYAPMSIEMQMATKYDQGIIRDNDDIEYVDNLQNEINIEDNQKATELFADALEIKKEIE